MNVIIIGHHGHSWLRLSDRVQSLENSLKESVFCKHWLDTKHNIILTGLINNYIEILKSEYNQDNSMIRKSEFQSLKLRSRRGKFAVTILSPPQSTTIQFWSMLNSVFQPVHWLIWCFNMNNIPFDVWRWPTFCKKLLSHSRNFNQPHKRCSMFIQRQKCHVML